MKRLFAKLHRKSRQHVRRRPYIIPLFGLLIGGLSVGLALWLGGNHRVAAANSHIVDLTIAGKQQVLASRAETVGELLDNLHIQMIPQDVVEPARDTPIVEDNFRVNIYKARPVTVIDSGQRIVTLTAQKSARVVAQDAGVTVYPEDAVSFAEGDLRQGILGEEVVLNRATAITLDLYGTANPAHTNAKTVDGLLKEKKISLASGDQLQPAAATPITPGMTVTLIRNGTQVTTVQEDIAPPVQYVDDASLSLGATAVRQAGTPGKRQVTYQITLQNNKETSRTVLQSAVITAPVPQIIARGKTVAVTGDKTALMAAAGISPGDYGYVNFIVSHESGWNPAARNGSGCLGLGQACPGSKLTAVCSLSDAVCQLRYFSGYAGRYGGWGGSYNFWLSHHYW